MELQFELVPISGYLYILYMYNIYLRITTYQIAVLYLRTVPDLFFGRVPFVLGINVGVNSSILRRVLKLLVIVQLSSKPVQLSGFRLRYPVSRFYSTLNLAD